MMSLLPLALPLSLALSALGCAAEAPLGPDCSQGDRCDDTAGRELLIESIGDPTVIENTNLYLPRLEMLEDSPWRIHFAVEEFEIDLSDLAIGESVSLSVYDEGYIRDTREYGFKVSFLQQGTWYELGAHTEFFEVATDATGSWGYSESVFDGEGTPNEVAWDDFRYGMELTDGVAKPTLYATQMRVVNGDRTGTTIDRDVEWIHSTEIEMEKVRIRVYPLWERWGYSEAFRPELRLDRDQADIELPDCSDGGPC